MHMHLVISVLSLACYLAAIGFLVALHFQSSGYSILGHAVSDYGVGPTRRMFAAYTSLGSAGGLVFAGALLTRATAVPGWLLGVLAVMVAARTGLTLFPTDLEGTKLTRTGYLHYFFAILGFAASYTVIRNLTPVFAGEEAWGPLHGKLNGLSTLATVALVGVCATMWKPLRRGFGLVERVFLLTVLVWFAVASAGMVVFGG
jgi:hypothetical membrane protein